MAALVVTLLPFAGLDITGEHDRVLVGVFARFRGDRRVVAVAAVASAGLVRGGHGRVNPLLNELVKLVVHRSRPVVADPIVHANGASFPSGHAQAAMVGYAVLLLVFLPVLRGLARPAAVFVAVLMVAAIGFSRVALGVHFVSDVLAGYVLGAAWVASMVALFNLWRRESGRPAVDPVGGLEPENARRLDPRSSGSEAA